MAFEAPKNKTGKVLFTILAGAGLSALPGVLRYSSKDIGRHRKFRNYHIDHCRYLRGNRNQFTNKNLT